MIEIGSFDKNSLLRDICKIRGYVYDCLSGAVVVCVAAVHEVLTSTLGLA